MPEAPTILLHIEPVVGGIPADLDDLAEELRPLAATIPQGDRPPQQSDALASIASLGSTASFDR